MKRREGCCACIVCTRLLDDPQYGPSVSSRSLQYAPEGTSVLVQRLDRKDFHVLRVTTPTLLDPLHSLIFPSFFLRHTASCPLSTLPLNKYLNKKRKRRANPTSVSPPSSPCAHGTEDHFAGKHIITFQLSLRLSSSAFHVPGYLTYGARSFCH